MARGFFLAIPFVVGCTAVPDLVFVDGGDTSDAADEGTPSNDATVDASIQAIVDASVDAADASSTTDANVPCPPPGAPQGTLCCGANGSAPPCFGLACGHCGDCKNAACPTGDVCCAKVAGGSGNYKSTTCVAIASAASCPP